MVEANDSWFSRQNSALQFPDLNCMSASAEPVQQGCFPSFGDPGIGLFCRIPILPGFRIPYDPKLNPQVANGAQGFHLFPSAHFQAPLPTPNLDCKDSEPASPHGLGGKAVPNTASGLNPQEANGAQRFHSLPSVHFETNLPAPDLDCKESEPASPYRLGGKAVSNKASALFGNRYLIFDQSGGNTRMIYNSLCFPHKDRSMETMKRAYGSDMDKQNQVAKIDLFGISKSLLHEKCDENHETREQSEMHEDTEEINALLYSDDEEEDDEDDDLMSTGHTPNVLKRSHEKLELAEEITEEVDSSGGPNKRLKVIQGHYKNSLQADNSGNTSLNCFREFCSDIESHYVTVETQEDSVSANKASRKAKIREMLRKLETIVPAAEGRDPMLVIDEAIDYLKSLKHMAKHLGLHYD